MIKATLKHINTHTKTEEIELPNGFNTGDIISVIATAMENFDYDDCIDGDIFEISVETGLVFHCYELANIYKYRLYEETPDGEYEWVADFTL